MHSTCGKVHGPRGWVLVLVHGSCAVTPPPGRRRKSHQAPQVLRAPEQPPAKNSVRVFFSPPAHPHLRSSLTTAPGFPGMPERPRTLQSLHKHLLNQSPSLRCSAVRHTRSSYPTNAFLRHKWVHGMPCHLCPGGVYCHPSEGCHLLRIQKYRHVFS